MPKKKLKIDYGQGVCQYRFCDLPDKLFPKKKEGQRFCCNAHRYQEWTLLHPRMSEDAAKQVPLDLEIIGRARGNIFDVLIPKKVENVKSASRSRSHIKRKILELLMKSNPTTLEINTYSGSTRGSSDISELREQGFSCECIKCGSVNRFKLTDEGRKKAVEYFKERR
jgi:predicted transcriptional regulator with HTH domain